MKDALERVRPVPDYTIRTGVVSAVAGPRTTVKISGGEVIVGHLKTYTPVVGEIVICLFYNGDGLALGAVAT